MGANLTPVYANVPKLVKGGGEVSPRRLFTRVFTRQPRTGGNTLGPVVEQYETDSAIFVPKWLKNRHLPF